MSTKTVNKPEAKKKINWALPTKQLYMKNL